MIFGNTSKYMLKYQKAKAKLVEYSTPNEDYPKFPLNSNELSFSTIYIISRYAECVIEQNIDELIELEELLPLVAQYYDAAFNSKDRQIYAFEFLLTGASAYFLTNNFGSAKVLVKKIFEENLVPEAGPQKLLLVIYAYLLLNKTMRYIKISDTPSKINNAFIDCFEKGSCADSLIEAMNNYRHEIYSFDNPDDVFCMDILMAIVFKSLENSAWTLLPRYSGESVDKWIPYIQKRFSIKMLWPSQRLIAEAGILGGKNAIVQLPTGVGKTKSIELIIKSAFISERAMNVIVVAPLRALCNEITFDLSKSFKDEVTVNQFSDILQDDFIFGVELKKEILICTPEKLNYVIHHDPDFINQIDLFIFDEGHMFDDGNRGVTYELLVSQIKHNLSEEQQLVLLSAVLPNSNQIKDWLFEENGVLAVDSNITATPKSIGFASTSKDIVFYSDDTNEEDFYVPRVLKITNLDMLPRERSPRLFPEVTSSVDIAIYNALKLCNNGGVAIYIGQQRTMKTVFNRIKELNQRNLDMTPFVENTNNEELEKLSWLLEQYYGDEHYYTIVSQLGVLPHSSNIPNGVKLAVEYALKKNYIFCVVCTSTLAQGVNIPIKTLLVTSIRNGLQIISTRNFQNLIGRAARSGVHTEGNIIITDPRIFDNKSKGRGYYAWQECIDLFDNNKSEDCSSSILTLVKNLRVDFETVYSGQQIIEYIIENYDKSDCFKTLAKAINKTYLKKKPQNTQNNIHEEIIFRQGILDSVENHLCLMLSTAEEGSDKREIAINLCKETLAYYLATEDERELLEKVFSKVAEKLDEYSHIQLFNYAHAMSGIDLSSKIESWIEESEITEVFLTEEELYKKIIDFFMTLKNVENKEQFLLICQMWIQGNTPKEINESIDMDVSDIDNICNKLISYDLNFFIGNICDLIRIDEDDDIINPIPTLTKLQKKVKYGVPNDTSVSICEKVFHDRFLSMLITDVINDKEVPTDKIIKLLKFYEDEIFDLLKSYPEYFLDRLQFLLS